MQKTNRSLGQALPLTVVALLVIVILGIGIIWLIQTMGGSRENTNATDSGVLNLNKKAVSDPTIAFNKQSTFQSMYKSCSGAKSVDLGTYNGMVSSAMLIALNASADGHEAGLKNADNLINELQGTEQSVGGQLKKVLSDPDAQNSWAKRHFEESALTNSVRMAGDKANLAWDGKQYQVSYLEGDSSDVGASNIPINKLVENMPFTYDENGMKDKPMDSKDVKNMVATDGFDKYMHGYQPISIPKLSRPIYAVPTQPKHQPHLVSQVTFSAPEHVKQPGDGKAFLPPNSFRAGSKTGDATSAIAHAGASAGLVGMPLAGEASEARLPQGFLIIDNSMTSDISASVPHNDTWEASEAGTGTLVYRPSHMFSTAGTINGVPSNALSNWLSTPRPANFDASKGPEIADDDGNALIYDSNGNPITSKADAAAQIPYDTNADHVVLATDRDSDPNGANPDSDCVLLATPTLPDNLSPFNRAYHPNANTTSRSELSLRRLIAAEQAKVWALHLYPIPYNGSTVGRFDKNFGLTGLRLYPNSQLPIVGGPYRYAPGGCKLPMGTGGQAAGYGDPTNLGQITTDGTIEDLFTQTTGTPDKVPYLRIDDGDKSNARGFTSKQALTPTEEVKRFIIQRMKEIKPQATQDDFNKVFKRKVSLASKLYVYLQTPSNPKSEFVVTETAPSWAQSFQADGKRHSFAAKYPIAGPQGYLIDAQNDFGIHDHLFMTNRVYAEATDVVSYQASSGANGLLGIVQFYQYVQGSGTISIPSKP